MKEPFEQYDDTIKIMQRWIKNSEKLVYSNYRKILSRNFTLPNGKSYEFEISQSNDTVTIVCFTPEQRIVCFKQFRPGPEEILFELPGGGIENGETPEIAAEKELREETGYSANLSYVGWHYRDAYANNKTHIFIGEDAVCIQKQDLEETESGEVILLSVDEFLEKLATGQLTDTAAGYSALYKAGLLR